MEINKKMSLKLLIDKNAEKVVFAEAGKDFVDFLFKILSLPLGQIIRLLDKQPDNLSITRLYQSFENLNNAYLQPNTTKDLLLNPTATNDPCLSHGAFSNGPFGTSSTTYWGSSSYSGSSPSLFGFGATVGGSFSPSCGPSLFGSSTCGGFVASVGGSSTPSFGGSLFGPGSTPVGSFSLSAEKREGEGGYVKGLVRYMVTDELSVSPLSMISGISVMKRHNMWDFDRLEEREVQFGFDEGLQLLKASLQRKEVLTYVYLTDKKHGQSP